MPLAPSGSVASDGDVEVGDPQLDRKLASTYHLQRQADEAHAALAAAQTALGDAPVGRPAEWWEEFVEIELKRLWLHYFFGSADVLSTR